MNPEREKRSLDPSSGLTGRHVPPLYYSFNLRLRAIMLAPKSWDTAIFVSLHYQRSISCTACPFGVIIMEQHLTTLLDSLPAELEASKVPGRLSENGYFEDQKDVYNGLVSEKQPSFNALRSKRKWMMRQFDLVETVFAGLGDVSLNHDHIRSTLQAIETSCQIGLEEELKLVEINTKQASCLNSYRSALEAVIDIANDPDSLSSQHPGSQFQSTTETVQNSKMTLETAFRNIRELESEIQGLEETGAFAHIATDRESDSDMSTDHYISPASALSEYSTVHTRVCDRY